MPTKFDAARFQPRPRINVGGKLRCRAYDVVAGMPLHAVGDDGEGFGGVSHERNLVRLRIHELGGCGARQHRASLPFLELPVRILADTFEHVRHRVMNRRGERRYTRMVQINIALSDGEELTIPESKIRNSVALPYVHLFNHCKLSAKVQQMLHIANFTVTLLACQEGSLPCLTGLS